MLSTLFDYSDTIAPLAAFFLFLSIKQKVPQIKPLLWYFFVTTITMGVSNYFADKHLNNLVIFHFYALFELAIILPVIESYNKKNYALVIGTLAVYLVFWLINVLLWEPFTVYNSNSSAVEALLILIFCLRYFLLLSKKADVLHFQKIPAFWLVFGFLFYCSTSILIQNTYSQISNYIDIGLKEAWDIILYLNLIKYLLIIVSGICYYRQPYQAPSS
jgi:hypothetical protein